MIDEKKIIESIREDGVLECVIKNYEDMNKEQLKTIFKEFYYAMDEHSNITDDGMMDVIDTLINELKCCWYVEE